MIKFNAEYKGDSSPMLSPNLHPIPKYDSDLASCRHWA